MGMGVFEQDYYAILNVGQSADCTEIKLAYRKLAMRYHPDRNMDDKRAEELFKCVKKAYETLSDEAKRKAYDESLKDKATAGEQQRERAPEYQQKGASHGKEYSEQTSRQDQSATKLAVDWFNWFWKGGLCVVVFMVSVFGVRLYASSQYHPISLDAAVMGAMESRVFGRVRPGQISVSDIALTDQRVFNAMYQVYGENFVHHPLQTCWLVKYRANGREGFCMKPWQASVVRLDGYELLYLQMVASSNERCSNSFDCKPPIWGAAIYDVGSNTLLASVPALYLNGEKVLERPMQLVPISCNGAFGWLQNNSSGKDGHGLSMIPALYAQQRGYIVNIISGLIFRPDGEGEYEYRFLLPKDEEMCVYTLIVRYTMESRQEVVETHADFNAFGWTYRLRAGE